MNIRRQRILRTLGMAGLAAVMLAITPSADAGRAHKRHQWIHARHHARHFNQPIFVHRQPVFVHHGFHHRVIVQPSHRRTFHSPQVIRTGYVDRRRCRR